ncbi:VOC family protein [Nesterenkonia lacusekhoensis]|uniref:3-demethylubiquinone-9 3-methyltransferase (Glyoxalase superfamily) n=1 Tax=Nesterenkonia lacusekhoensis TaxID=150832 RepID=A0ABS4SYT0_9MICC|nr:VOC family protein [Nesterenkonia lacusekhoensis]MBP2317293.1 putative 3-demethylubiquinone-9 3-methyltransferase (glyoxalase superfamily) [Nesterenkonia lacusekhoensis]
MTLSFPFLMFQGRAQEAIDHYLETFPDAELVAIQHHLEGTEIFDPATEQEEEEQEIARDREEESGEDTESTEEDAEADSVDEGSVDEDSDDAAGSEDATDSAAEDSAETPEGSAEEDSAGEDSDESSAEQDSGEEDSAEEAEAETAQDDAEQTAEEPPVLVATAQLKIGNQVLMIQDSLVRHAFSFTPSTSIAVVVDSASEFDHIVGKLAEGGHYLMEPGSYEFAQNYAWVTDRFGFSWQVNHPLGTPEETAQAKAPEWG